MSWRRLLISAFSLLVLPSSVAAQNFPPGFAKNPFGVAGSPVSLQRLSMPKTSSFYDWIPHDYARYITVRPYSLPRGGVSADDSSNPYFWNLSSGMIGRSDVDRVKFNDFVRRNKGAIWIIGNEPDSSSQDNLSPTNYAKMYRTYFSQVKQLDASARFAIASITGTTFVREFGHMREYYDAVFSEHERLYQAPLVFDYWNMHAYYAGWLQSMPKDPQAMTNSVFEKIVTPYLQYRLIARSGQYAAKPILATEVGLILPGNNQLELSQSQAIEFMRLYTRRLSALVAQGIVKDFFWFYGGHASGDYLHTSLLDSDWRTPSPLGAAYAQEAKNWDRQFGLEQADFNQDRKIGILDFNRLAQAFGSTNALMSLDADPRITRTDLTIFKQVFAIANR